MQTGSQAPSQGLRTYYLLVATQTVSQVGSRISFFAVGIAVFTQTSHATPLAIISFCQTLPWIVGAGFAGAVADRYDRRRLLILANAGFVMTSGLLLVSFASGAFRLWHLYALALITSSILTVSGPAFRASVAMLVPDGHRDRANAIAQMTAPAANAIAPALAGLLYAVIGVTGAILIDIATFGVAILALLAVRIPMPAKTTEGAAMAGAVWRQAFDGVAYLWRRPPLLGLCLVVSIVSFLIGGLGVLILPYPLARTHSTVAFGIVLACADIGTAAGAAAMAAWGGTRPRIHTVMLALFVAGLLLAVAGVARTTAELAASFFAFMFMLPFVNTAVDLDLPGQGRARRAGTRVRGDGPDRRADDAAGLPDRRPADGPGGGACGALARLAVGGLAGGRARRGGDGAVAGGRRAGDGRAQPRRLCAASHAPARGDPPRPHRHAGRGRLARSASGHDANGEFRPLAVVSPPLQLVLGGCPRSPVQSPTWQPQASRCSCLQAEGPPIQPQAGASSMSGAGRRRPDRPLPSLMKSKACLTTTVDASSTMSAGSKLLALPPPPLCY